MLPDILIEPVVRMALAEETTLAERPDGAE